MSDAESHRPRSLQDIFADALELSRADRARFLDAACRGDAALRVQVESLLDAHDRAGKFLAEPTYGSSGQQADNPAEDIIIIEEEEDEASSPPPHDREEACVGTAIGPYRLREKIGEGGFGTVYLAEQLEPIKRKVALKVLKPGMDSHQVIARFEAERQALALMDHPNIAKVLDAGQTKTNLPFFVMELVRGVPITVYCDTYQLGLRDRLRLFVPVCHAIQHAHQKGIIHRDIKPSNVLVGIYDGRPEPKVIDFGIGKAIGQSIGEGTALTPFRAVMGTLQYLSPEQAVFNAVDIDTRSDVYGLGILLFELVTGSPPISREQVQTTALDEMLRIIREETTPTASRRLSQAVDGPKSVFEIRGTSRPTLLREVRGDLDWVVTKSLEKDRSRRYQSAAALAEDIDRFLADEPVEAGPPSAGYRLRKLLKRHRGFVAAICTIAIALVGGIIGTSIGIVQANRARDREAEQRRNAEFSEQVALQAAEQEKAAKEKEAGARKHAEEVAKLLESIFDDSNPRATPSGDLQSRLAGRLDKLADTLRTEYKGDPLVRARLRTSLGIAELWVGEPKKAQELLEAALTELQAHPEADKQEVIRTKKYLATVYGSVGRARDAASLLEELSAASSDTSTAGSRSRLRARTSLAHQYQHTGRNKEAIAALERVRAESVQRFGTDHRETLKAQAALGAAYVDAGRTSDGLRLLEAALGTLTKRLGRDAPDTLATMADLAVAYLAADRLADAIALHEEVRDRMARKYGPDHPEAFEAVFELANAYEFAGRTEDALRCYEQILQKQTKKLGADHPETLLTRWEIAHAYELNGQLDEATTAYEEVRKRQLAKLGEGHPHTWQSGESLALVYEQAGRYEDAINLLESIKRSKTEQLGPESQDTLRTLHNIAIAYRDAHRYKEAITLFEEVRDKRIRLLGAEHQEVQDAMENLGIALGFAGRHSEAAALLERVRDLRIKVLGKDHQFTLGTLSCLALEYYGGGRPDDAIQLLKQVVNSRERIQGANHPATLKNRLTLARIYNRTGRWKEAVAVFEEVHARQAERFGASHQDTLATQSELAMILQEAGESREAAREWQNLLDATPPGPATESDRAYTMALLGMCLLKAGRPVEAEATLRDCLAIRGRKEPDRWSTHNTKALIGASLLAQRRYADAEPLLLAGFEGMNRQADKIPEPGKPRLKECVEHLVKLYEATGQEGKAKTWRAKLPSVPQAGAP